MNEPDKLMAALRDAHAAVSNVRNVEGFRVPKAYESLTCSYPRLCIDRLIGVGPDLSMSSRINEGPLSKTRVWGWNVAFVEGFRVPKAYESLTCRNPQATGAGLWGFKLRGVRAAA